MAQPRPSLALILDIDESLATEETRLEIGRCYSYVGSTIVRTHPAAEDGSVENNAIFMVKLGNRRYLRSADEGADQVWNDIIERWLSNEFARVGNNMKIYNRRQREIGNDELFFTFMYIELENGDLTVRLHLDSQSDVEPACAAMITRMRTLLNDGTLGEDIARISMPSHASYEQQKAAGLTAREARAMQEAAEQEAAALKAAEEARKAAEEADENFIELPETPDKDSGNEIEAIRAEVEAKYALDDPDFIIDYRLWDVEQPDGSACAFDSEAGVYLDEEAER